MMTTRTPGAKPPRRGAEPPETARSASRGAERSVALGVADLGDGMGGGFRA